MKRKNLDYKKLIETERLVIEKERKTRFIIFLEV